MLNKANLPAELSEAGQGPTSPCGGRLPPGSNGVSCARRPHQLALACWAMVHGLSTLVINGAIPVPMMNSAVPAPAAAAERQLVTGVLNLLGDGLRAP